MKAVTVFFFTISFPVKSKADHNKDLEYQSEYQSDEDVCRG